MHQERKIETLKHSKRETFNKQEQLMNKIKNIYLLKMETFRAFMKKTQDIHMNTHEQGSRSKLFPKKETFSSSHLKILAMVRAKLQAS